PPVEDANAIRDLDRANGLPIDRLPVGIKLVRYVHPKSDPRAVAVYVPPRIANQEIGEHAFIAVMITRLRLYIRPRTPGCWLGGPHHHQTFDNGLCLEPPLCCRYPHCVHEEVGNDRLVRGKGEHFFRHSYALWIGELRNAR